MASITIRNLDDNLKARLRVEAANHGHSMEEEVRVILRRALTQTAPQGGLGSRIHARFASSDVELDLPQRKAKARPARLDK